MKIIASILLCLLGLPAIAQKISDLPETLVLTNGHLFIVAKPGVANYKVTYGSLITNLQASLELVSPGVSTTNANQFGASTTLTIKSGALLTNIVVANSLDADTATVYAGTLKVRQSAGIANLYVTNILNLYSATGVGYVLTDVAGNGALTLQAPAGGSGVTTTNIAVGQTLYLDAAFGNDATASRTNQLRPFLTVSNAIAAMRSGDTLVVRGGTYLIDPHPDLVNTPFSNLSGGVMLSNLSNLKIIGQAGSVWKMSRFYSNALSYSASMFDLVRCTNVVIEGLTMVGIRTNAVVAQHYAVRPAACENVEFSRVAFSNWQDQGVSDLNETTLSHDIKAINCLFADIGGTNCYNLGADGTAWSCNSSNLVLTGNRFYRNLRDFEVYSLSDVRALRFEGNYSRGCYQSSILLIGTNAAEVRIANNIAIGYATNALAATTWLTIRTGSNVVLQANQVSGFGAGINYEPVSGSLFEDIEAWDNVFQDFTDFVITIHPYTGSTQAKRISIMRNKFKNTAFSAIWFGGANNSRVEHNELVDCNTTTQAAGGIKIGHPTSAYTNGTNISIVGNKIYTSDMTASASTGIVIYANSYSNSVWGNEISRRYQGQIHDLGSGTMTQPLNKVAPGKMLYSDTNSRIAEVTIGSGVAFDGITGTLTGSGVGGGVFGSSSQVLTYSNGQAQGYSGFIYNPTNGNVGIGTSVPSQRLHIVNSEAGVQGLNIEQNATGSEGLHILTERYGIGVQSADAEPSRYLLQLTGNGGATKAMFVGNSGLVGIGTAVPSSTLDVIGQVRAASAIFTNSLTVPTLNVTTLNANILNLTNPIVQNFTVVAPSAPSVQGALYWTDGTNVNVVLRNSAGAFATNKLSMAAWP